MPDTLGDRMKRHEVVTRTHLTRRMPVIVRVDGRAFHTYTKGMLPFDNSLRDAMVDAAIAVAAEMQGFEVAYHQSDEVSFLLTDYATFETNAWFDYNVQKVATISASVMTANFNKRIVEIFGGNGRVPPTKMAYFDARAYNVPKEDVANYFLWRSKDWERNSLSMFCRQFFSAKKMHGQGRADQHEMLHAIGKNWATDVSPCFRNGSFIVRGEANSNHKVVDDVCATYADVSKLIDQMVYKVQAKEPVKLLDHYYGDEPNIY